MEEWKEYKISEIIEEIAMGPFGSNIKVDNFIDFGIPVLNGSNLQGFKLNEDSFNYVSEEKADSLGKANASRGDVVITHRGTLGQIVYIPLDSKYERYVISQSQFRLRLNQNIIRPDFFVYFFHTRIGQHRILMNASQVGVPALARPTSTFKEITIPVPPMEIQNRVMAILLSLDDKIELNHCINKNLEQQAHALFKSWFVDFEPFKDGKFVDSELGMIPEGWKVGNLLDIAKLYDNLRKPLSSRDRSSMAKLYPYYGATSVMDYVDNYIFNGVYLLMGEDGSVVNENGYPYLQYVFGKFWPNNHSHVMQGKNGFTTEMLHCFLMKKNISGIVTGAVQAKISQQSMKKILLVIPNKNICEEFACIIAPIYANIRKIINENKILSQLRDTLLPKLMSGELKTNDFNN